MVEQDWSLLMKEDMDITKIRIFFTYPLKVALFSYLWIFNTQQILQDVGVLKIYTRPIQNLILFNLNNR